MFMCVGVFVWVCVCICIFFVFVHVYSVLVFVFRRVHARVCVGLSVCVRVFDILHIYMFTMTNNNCISFLDESFSCFTFTVPMREVSSVAYTPCARDTRTLVSILDVHIFLCCRGEFALISESLLSID